MCCTKHWPKYVFAVFLYGIYLWCNQNENARIFKLSASEFKAYVCFP